ncbi:hypothetical protein, partial [Shigella sonnei]
ASSLSSGEYLPGSLQGKISSDGCLKKEQMVVSAIASTPHYSQLTETVSFFYSQFCLSFYNKKVLKFISWNELHKNSYLFLLTKPFVHRL